MQAFQDDPIQLGIQVGFDATHGTRVDINNFIHQCRLVYAFERQFAGDHFIEHDTQREDIGPMVGLLPLHLFRRHVSGRPDSTSFLRQPRNFTAAGPQFRKSEVHDLDYTIFANHDIFRLDIAMDYTFFVRSRQSFGDLYHDVDRLGLVQRRHAAPESLSIDELHDNEHSTVMLLDIVNRANIRMVER